MRITLKSPVVILTRLNNPYLLDAAIKNGAQAALPKSTASGDILNKTMSGSEAIGRVQQDRKRDSAGKYSSKHNPELTSSIASGS